MKEISLIIPCEPPTVNHYIKHTRSGRHYKTAKAESWDEIFALEVRDYSQTVGDRHVPGKAHEVTYVVYQGFKSKGDVDNYAKCILDSLVTCGVLKSDASVVSLHAHKLRDRLRPRTEIKVTAL